MDTSSPDNLEGVLAEGRAAHGHLTYQTKGNVAFAETGPLA